MRCHGSRPGVRSSRGCPTRPGGAVVPCPALRGRALAPLGSDSRSVGRPPRSPRPGRHGAPRHTSGEFGHDACPPSASTGRAADVRVEWTISRRLPARPRRLAARGPSSGRPWRPAPTIPGGPGPEPGVAGPLSPGTEPGDGLQRPAVDVTGASGRFPLTGTVVVRRRPTMRSGAGTPHAPWCRIGPVRRSRPRETSPDTH